MLQLYNYRCPPDKDPEMQQKDLYEDIVGSMLENNFRTVLPG